MAQPSGRAAGGTTIRRADPRPVRVCLLIQTHALPPLTYAVPERLRSRVRVGSAVVATLSEYSRLGIVVGYDDENERELEELTAVEPGLSLPRSTVRLCRRICEASAVPLATAIRAALPPGLETGTYRVIDPASDWKWEAGSSVTRVALRRALGKEGLKAAETEGRIRLAPRVQAPARTEWAATVPDADADLRRVPRQRELYEALKRYDREVEVSTLLSETGAHIATLRALARRGAVRLESFRQPADIHETRGEEALPPLKAVEEAVAGAEARLWRVPAVEQDAAVGEVVRAALEADRRALVLVPEINGVERLAHYLAERLPAGYTITAYHGGPGLDRSAVYAAARRGNVDVLVGTRAAALLPLPELGVICVVDEPNDAHRAGPGYEGLPMHARDISVLRGAEEGSAVVMLSPTPSLRLYGTGMREMPSRQPSRWPAVRIVDMRGTGASLSSTVLQACRRSVEAGESVGVVANRLGYAVTVSCAQCGGVKTCPNCDLPLALTGGGKVLGCARCAYRRKMTTKCDECGSDRMSATGLAAERLREDLAAFLERPVGLLTAGDRLFEAAQVVVGSARSILEREWDVLLVPDVDSMLHGSDARAVERAFRFIYRAAEMTRRKLFVQTRVPEHYALRTALRGDYQGFAASELVRLRDLGYPPFGHVAYLMLEGPEAAVRGAVESRLRPALGTEVAMSGAVPFRGAGGPGWRVMLRGRERAEVARAAGLAARLVSKGRGTRGLKLRVEIDPEEV